MRVTAWPGDVLRRVPVEAVVGVDWIDGQRKLLGVIARQSELGQEVQRTVSVPRARAEHRQLYKGRRPRLGTVLPGSGMPYRPLCQSSPGRLQCGAEAEIPVSASGWMMRETAATSAWLPLLA